MIYLAADHAGYNLKEEIKKYLSEWGYKFEDVGAFELDPQDDYPDFILKAARKVSEKEGDLGIGVCGTGIGTCIAANKVKGVRAALAYNEYTAKKAREHNQSNFLCLGGRILDAEQTKRIVKTWLETEFIGEKRHVRRLEKITAIEA